MKNSILTRTRRGFTLVETIVTVGLISVLAAFVVPAVMQKSGVADPVKVQNDLGAVEVALSGFLTDTKGARPSTLLNLTQAVSGTDALLASTDTFTTVQQFGWKGPYLGVTVGSGQKLPTGFGLQVNQALEDFDAVKNVGRLGASTDNPLVTGNSFDPLHARFIAVRMDAVPLKQAKLVNELFDGIENTTSASTDAQLTGRVRFSAATTGTNATVSLYHLVIPINK